MVKLEGTPEEHDTPAKTDLYVNCQTGAGEAFRDKRTSIALTEQEIVDFCKGCDRLAPNGECNKLSVRRQARFATVGLCEKAIAKGSLGVMTTGGFLRSQ
jgi:hypothetical protein